jgi:hypothetical protein
MGLDLKSNGILPAFARTEDSAGVRIDEGLELLRLNLGLARQS